MCAGLLPPSPPVARPRYTRAERHNTRPERPQRRRNGRIRPGGGVHFGIAPAGGRAGLLSWSRGWSAGPWPRAQYDFHARRGKQRDAHRLPAGTKVRQRPSVNHVETSETGNAMCGNQSTGSRSSHSRSSAWPPPSGLAPPLAPEPPESRRTMARSACAMSAPLVHSDRARPSIRRPSWLVAAPNPCATGHRPLARSCRPVRHRR